MPAGTVGDGLKRLAPLFEPIYEALERESRASAWWQADETRWSVFETTAGKSSFGWFLWVFLSERSVVHVIDPSRSAQVIEEHLGTVTDGILVVDRYSAYKSFAKKREGVRLAFCWSHARRDFIDAGNAYDELAGWAEQWRQGIDELFHRNRLRCAHQPDSSEFTAEDALLREALSAMHERAKAELAEKKLHHRRAHVLKSLLAHWEGLVVFVDHPQIPMDNNASERTLRAPVVGRKSYYGSGALWSARFTAVMFSIFATLELYNINCKQWLTDYLTACAAAGGLTPPADIEAHLPWNISGGRKAGRRYNGRVFSAEELATLTALVEQNTAGTRTAIAREAARLFDWRTPTGELKVRSMREALEKMEAHRRFVLPASKGSPGGTPKRVAHTSKTAPGDEIFTPAGHFDELRVEVAEDAASRALWDEYIDRYHYLGYAPTPGGSLKYFVHSADGVLAVLGFTSAAWKIAPRDEYIGWSEDERRQRLSLLVNNHRFLILPWVCSRNLASKVLSMAAARLREDWYEYSGYRPVLLETFVERERFTGACYKAANWHHVGATAGRGRNDRDNQIRLPAKEIFLYPLVPDFRKPLLINSS